MIFEAHCAEKEQFMTKGTRRHIRSNVAKIKDLMNEDSGLDLGEELVAPSESWKCAHGRAC